MWCAEAAAVTERRVQTVAAQFDPYRFELLGGLAPASKRVSDRISWIDNIRISWIDNIRISWDGVVWLGRCAVLLHTVSGPVLKNAGSVAALNLEECTVLAGPQPATGPNRQDDGRRAVGGGRLPGGTR